VTRESRRLRLGRGRGFLGGRARRARLARLQPEVGEHVDLSGKRQQDDLPHRRDERLGRRALGLVVFTAFCQVALVEITVLADTSRACKVATISVVSSVVPKSVSEGSAEACFVSPSISFRSAS
jgi:hypothetical protein